MKANQAQIRAVMLGLPDVGRPGGEPWTKDDACWALVGAAPTVSELYAWGPGEPYAIRIMGVPGAYIVVANAFDPHGLFSSQDEAVAAAHEHWPGVELFQSEDEVWEYAKQEGFI